MTHVLVVKSSIQGDASVSSRMADALVDILKANDAQLEVTQRDLGAQPLPHLDVATFAAFGTPAEQRTPHQQTLTALSDGLIAELKSADILVLGMPLYNFGAPSGFKAWIDQVCRVGETFTYTSEGPKGLTGIDQAFVVASRGGAYAGTPTDSQTPWLNMVLGFMGVGEVRYVYAEGLAQSDTREQALTDGIAAAQAAAQAIR